MTDTAKVKLVVNPNKTLERDYIDSTFSDAGIGDKRRACMSGETAGSVIRRDGVTLNPARICMAWLERSAENHATAPSLGIFSAYIRLAEQKGFKGLSEDGEALLVDVVQFIDKNPKQGPISDNVLNLPNGQTLTIPSGRAYDAGFSEGYLRLEAGQKLPATPLKNKTPQELQEYVLACIKNNSLNLGTCKTVGIEHLQRVVTPADAQGQRSTAARQ